MRFKLLIVSLMLTVFSTHADEPLTPGAKAWIDHYQATRQNTSQAYLYLLGMDAPEGADVLAHGARKLTIIKRLEADVFAGAVPHVSQSDALQHLPELAPLNHDLFCHNQDFRCYQSLINNDKGLQPDEHPQHIWLARYQAFLQYRDFQTLTRPHLTEVIPGFTELTNANWLLLRQAINEQQAGRCNKAQQSIRQDIKAWRYHLSAADRLVYKAFYANLIGADIEVLGYLHQSGCTQLNTIDLLDNKELSMQLVMLAEYMHGVNFINMAFGPNAIYEPDADRTIELNAGINYIYAFYKPIARFGTGANKNPFNAYVETNKAHDQLFASATAEEKRFFGRL